MKLQQRVREAQGETEVVRVVDAWYEVESDGYQRDMPVLHYHGRSESGEYRHFAIDGYRPYFYVSQQEDEETLQNLAHDRRVMDVSVAERTGVHRGEWDTPLVKVTVECPWHVGQLRDEFDRTWEADVLFPQRFLIDRGVTGLARIPVESNGYLDATDVEAVDEDDFDGKIDPRVVTYDIEVATREALEHAFEMGIVDGDRDAFELGAFPDVNTARRPITAIALHDSYDDEIATFVLRADAWGENASPEIGTDVYDDEADLLTDVVRWLVEKRPDVLTAWNADFDAPYFLNRCKQLRVPIERLSPTGNVDEHNGGGRFINSDITGVHVFDLLKAYEKSQYTELKSSKLENVAAEETEMEKLDVDEQHAWVHDPERFTKYVSRDTEATVAINEEVNLL